MRRPLAVWPLVFLLLLLGVGGLYGGIPMLTEPTGGSIGLTEVLPLLPVADYTLPGLFLLIVMGLAPLILSYGLLARPDWPWAQAPSRWRGHHWAWTGTLGLGVTLAIWLIVQGLLIGFRWPIQFITAADAFLVILLALLPGVRRFYAR
ncbi:MAG: hypothetical protein ABIJ00_04490 [Candidatus Eisenbacteria bacterium]